MNKLIFSRKGFDSKYGGIPSTWAEDGELVSFPIPSTGKLDDGIAPDATRYDAITGGARPSMPVVALSRQGAGSMTTATMTPTSWKDRAHGTLGRRRRAGLRPR